MICLASPNEDSAECAPYGSGSRAQTPGVADAGEAWPAVHCGGFKTPGIPGRGGVTAATLDSKSSAREGVRVQLPPPVPFLDNVPHRLVGESLAWGCSSVGRAQGWQSWGQGFDSPQLQHFYSALSVGPILDTQIARRRRSSARQSNRC